MHELKEHIENLKKQLGDIQGQLQPFLNKEAKEEIQSQLKAISKSTDKLSQNNVNIPAELRELKFKLIKQLDEFKEAEELHKKLLTILSAYVSIKPIRSNTKPEKKPMIKKEQATTPKFELVNLVNSGLLSANTKLVKRYKGILLTGIITKEGKIKTTHNGITTLHNSPSSAAVAFIQKPTNGWTWWAVEGDAKDRTLNYYRQQYLNKHNETRR
jgi:hypothetical protein